MPRSAASPILFSIASGRASSRKKSAGPPMPNDVRDASGSSTLIPGRPRSQATLDFVRQVIAQLLDVAGAHQQHEVVRSDDLLERLLRALEAADVQGLRNLVREVCGENTGDVLLAGAVGIENE